jgi:hypothetical protein
MKELVSDREVQVVEEDCNLLLNLLLCNRKTFSFHCMHLPSHSCLSRSTISNTQRKEKAIPFRFTFLSSQPNTRSLPDQPLLLQVTHQSSNALVVVGGGLKAEHISLDSEKGP